MLLAMRAYESPPSCSRPARRPIAGSPEPDDAPSAAAETAELNLNSARYRIDRWTAHGWEPVRGFADQLFADRTLAAWRHQAPEQLFRLTRRLDSKFADRAGPHIQTTSVHERLRVQQSRVSGQPVGRILGALGLVALVTAACAFHWMDSALNGSATRSTAPTATMADGQTVTAPTVDVQSAAMPEQLAGRWGAGPDGCDDPSVVFLPDREIRVRDDRANRVIGVADYRSEGPDLIAISYVGGAEAMFQIEGGALTLAGAHIAQVQVTPQHQSVMRRCGQSTAAPSPDTMPVDSLPNTPTEAFRLAVSVGDDLAAALALARGLPPLHRIGDNGESALEWVIAHDRPILVGKLIAAGFDPNAVDPQGRTMLSLAVEANSTALVDALIAAGADPRLEDRDGARPVDHAAAQGNQLLIDILLSARP